MQIKKSTTLKSIIRGGVFAWVVMLIFSIVLFVTWQIWSKDVRELNKATEASALKEKLAYQQKLYAACQFPDGYVLTGSGYWFNLKKFNDFISDARQDAKNRAGKDDYNVLPITIRYELDKNNSCRIAGFSMSMLWNEHVLKPNYFKVFASFPPENWTNVEVNACYEDWCTPQAEAKKRKYSSNFTEPSAHKSNDEQEFKLINYPNLTFKIQIGDIDKNGQYIGDKVLYDILKVKNLENYNFEYQFNCLALSLPARKLPLPISELQSMFDKTRNIDCLSPSEASFSRLFFDGGHASVSFKTYVLSDIVNFLQAVRDTSSQFITKERT